MLIQFTEVIAGIQFDFGKLQNGNDFIYLVSDGETFFVIAKNREGQWCICSMLPNHLERISVDILLVVRTAEKVQLN